MLFGCASGGLQEAFYLSLKDGGIGSSDMFGVDASIAVNQKRDRQSQNATVQLSSLRSAHYDGIVHVELLVERAYGFDAVVHRDADDLQAAIAVPLLQFYEVRDLLAAGIAPRRPEIEQNDFAAIGRQTQIWTVRLRKSEIRREKAGVCAGRCGAGSVIVQKKIPGYDSAKKNGTCGKHESRCWTQRLFSLRDGIAFVDPVCAEIVGNVEHLHVGEAHGLQGVICGLHVGAMAPGAAPAIQNDELSARQGLYALAELMYAALGRRGANVFRPWDVRLREQNVRTHLDHERFIFPGVLDEFYETFGVDQAGGGDGRCLTGSMS